MPERPRGVALRAPRVYVWSESARDVLAWDLDLIFFAEALARGQGLAKRRAASSAPGAAVDET